MLAWMQFLIHQWHACCDCPFREALNAWIGELYGMGLTDYAP